MERKESPEISTGATEMTDTSLIDVLKAARDALGDIVNKQMVRGGMVNVKNLHAKRDLDAHIARLESPELVGRVQVAIMDATHDKAGTHDREAKAAIDAVLG